MTLQEIKSAVDRGQSVQWANQLYEVQKHHDEYYVVCSSNGHTTKLTDPMQERPSEFYISKGKDNE